MAEPQTKPTRYTVEFGRIGRTHDLRLELLARDADEFAERVHNFADRYLGSSSFDVTVDLAASEVWIEGGRFGKGRISRVDDGGGRCGESVPQAGYDVVAPNAGSA